MPGSSGGARCHVQVFPCVVNLLHIYVATRPYFVLPKERKAWERGYVHAPMPQKDCCVESIIIARNSKCFLKHL